MPPIIFLMGPTASGKTQLALSLAQELPIEIISVDSAMVYQGLDIGTAKPSLAIRSKVPHHLIDICDPTVPFSVAEFLEKTPPLIESIIQRKKCPVLVGGTMLYFHALLVGLSELPKADLIVRAQIQESAQQLGWAQLHKTLASLDQKSASRIHPHDSSRILRALEVYQLTGKPLSTLQTHRKNFLTHPTQAYAIAPLSRELLHTRIANRFHEMMAHGLLDEVKTLFDRGDLSLELPAIRSVGYRQLWNFLEGSIELPVAISQAISASRQLAKRQLTWLRQFEKAFWLESEHPDNVSLILKKLQEPG